MLALTVSEDALFSAPSPFLCTLRDTLIIVFTIDFHLCPLDSEEWHPPLHLAPDRVDGITDSMNMNLANSRRY